MRELPREFIPAVCAPKMSTLATEVRCATGDLEPGPSYIYLVNNRSTYMGIPNKTTKSHSTQTLPFKLPPPLKFKPLGERGSTLLYSSSVALLSDLIFSKVSDSLLWSDERSPNQAVYSVCSRLAREMGNTYLQL